MEDVKRACTFAFINTIKNRDEAAIGGNCSRTEHYGNHCTLEIFESRAILHFRKFFLPTRETPDSCNNNNKNNNNDSNNDKVRWERFMAGRAIFARERWNRGVADHAVTFSLVRSSPINRRSLFSRTTAERNERRFYERKSKDSKAFQGNSETVFQSKVMQRAGTHWL